MRVHAYGIPNCVGLAVNPITGDLWCSVNERDALGDNLVPDYITHVQDGGFHGWPSWYMGGTPQRQTSRVEGQSRHARRHFEPPQCLAGNDVLHWQAVPGRVSRG